MAMAEKLVILRGKRTQEEVAYALNISKSALAMYEAGKRVPRDPTKARIAKYYKKSVPYIFLMKKNTKCDFKHKNKEKEVREMELIKR